MSTANYSDPDRKHLIQETFRFGVPAGLTLLLGLVLTRISPLAVLGWVLIFLSAGILACITIVWWLHSLPPTNN